MEKISSRKKEHVEMSLKAASQYAVGAGFDRIRLIHNALPELDFDDVDLSGRFLEKKIRCPLMITAVTGGYPKAKEINRKLAEAAEKHGIAFGLGSQRAMIERPGLADTFKMRKYAPSIPIVANIGAVQLKKYPVKTIEHLVSSVEADGLAIHLNPLQEVIQPEGDKDYSGVLKAIEKTCSSLGVPVIVKETGAGIDREVAEKLKAAGVAWIDVSGSGGTSWSRIEYLRSKGAVPGFEDWGIPTVECLMMCRGVLPLIASGGIRSGIDAAKAIALGADMAGAAQPFLAALMKKRLDEELTTWEKQLRIAAFLTGSRTVAQLKAAKCILG
ncbi:type 2 isopentenyl-diphosphate Delta-isomerase [Candidatus Micrarchaeota archaeon]|nr:type 2 isopentenyl-diphosphate Delta-isomerase [Candidatus Micrarchaeota archaeon]